MRLPVGLNTCKHAGGHDGGQRSKKGPYMRDNDINLMSRDTGLTASDGIIGAKPKRRIQPRSIIAIDTVHLNRGSATAAEVTELVVNCLGLQPAKPPAPSDEQTLTYRLDRICVEITNQRPMFSPPSPEFASTCIVGSPLASHRDFFDRSLFGHLMLCITDFDDAMATLRAWRHRPEIYHQDMGLCRGAVFRDPMGNFIHLIETRPL